MQLICCFYNWLPTRLDQSCTQFRMYFRILPKKGKEIASRILGEIEKPSLLARCCLCSLALATILISSSGKAGIDVILSWDWLAHAV